MAKEENSANGNQPDAKQKSFDLSQLSRPATSISTSVGTLYLYWLRRSDLSAIEALPDEDPAARIRAFLPHIASRIEAGSKGERPPLTTEEVDQLSSSDWEQISEVYAKTLLHGSSDGDDALRGPEREASEPAIAFLDRLLKLEVRARSQQMQRMREKMSESTSSIFDQVRRSSSALGSTLSAFDQLTKRAAPVDIHVPGHIHAMNERSAREASERAEELEMVRLTGKMTAESAKTLKDLAEAATVLLEQLNERDKRADQSTRKQIRIAVWSVGVSAALALLAFIVSGLAYYQDKDNNASGERWQSELIAAVREGSCQSDDAKSEAQRLRDRVADLEARIAKTESASVARKPAPMSRKPGQDDGQTP